ncbi:MAG TPA: decarboxylating 6-phosphogluconate dehydrogenase [Usitatibacter sp.]|jgi:6-phosphogluconate dehydrogenase|nr:decarboxylating 6-phosphogluconate dehydrogenase [Usitatibacter sp.]
MQLGIVGLGRMGANMARRLMAAGHECVVHDVDAAAIDTLAREGARPAATLEALASGLAAPRAVWIMVPADRVAETLAALAPRLVRGDTLIDGGNSHFKDDIPRARELTGRGLHFVDVGTSGGVWGLANGYCLTIGGEDAAVRRLQPIFAALAPEHGYVHCGPAGAGHFAKMVHNGIEYGVMAAYAEGFNLLGHAGAHGYDLDVAKIAETWRHGSVIRSWLLDLAAEALARDPALASFGGVVADSGEGRWTVEAAVEAAAPVPVLAAALFSRFASRGEDDFSNRMLCAMRREFGGHEEPRSGKE